MSASMPACCTLQLAHRQRVQATAARLRFKPGLSELVDETASGCIGGLIVVSSSLMEITLRPSRAFALCIAVIPVCPSKGLSLSPLSDTAPAIEQPEPEAPLILQPVLINA